ncbi:MAG TPA: PHB depolymerase family esterase [Burkholderiaceae bacterium]|nr:PHB depolymerase family esterase [Burkholderiaceae bacterium]
MRRYGLLLAIACLLASALARAAATQTLIVDGRERSYLVHRPSGAGRSGAPALVVVLHGGFGSADRAQQVYGWDALADREGFVVVYPNGVARAWNAGGACCGRPQREKIDDVAFLGALLRKMIREQGVDPRRLYLTGISNGAALALDYACASAQPPLAAIGSVSGGISVPCDHPAGVSLLEIHGLSDQNIPMLGGVGTRGVSGVSWLPVPEAVERFRTSAGCEAAAVEVRGEVTTRTFSCKAGRVVELITIAKAGHQWPGARSPDVLDRALGLDPPSNALNATEVLWEFFRAQRLPDAN